MLVAALLAAACGGGEPSGAAGVDASLPVDVAIVGTRDLDVTIDAVGTAYASGQVDIRPQISGTLMTAPFVEGDAVEAGHVLAVFDDSKARASLALVQAQLDSSRARLAVATERLGRFRSLAAEDLVSREEYATLDAEQKSAAASVREKEAEVRLAERNLEDYTLKAPIAGRMGIRHVDVGNYVEAGTVLATLVAADPLEVLFTVPASALEGIAVGQDAQIRDTDPARTVIARGRIRVLDPRVDEATRMASVKALVPNPDHRLKAGQFVGVTLVREHRAAAPVVPEDAVLPSGGKTWVFVIDGDRASRREVTIGQRLSGLVEVRSGVKAGDTIVVRGQHRLSEGSRVEKNVPAAAPVTGGAGKR
jgi:RND family efflux transporter MFP subunit